MKYDLVMVAASRDEDLKRMTQQAINSCLADNVPVNVILVETHEKTAYHNVNKTIMYKGEFNYNHALNLGIAAGKADIVIMANNDLLFQRGWSSIGQTMIDNDYLSASALSNDFRQRPFKRGNYAYEGYLIGMQLTGWCIFAQRKLFERIGKLDEGVRFWYSDNVYAEQLQAEGIAHALICNVNVLHLGSRTLSKTDHKTRNTLIYAEGKKFHQRHPENIQKKLR